ncbi:MAG: lamin tail domain-containing protein, partial [Candidatus Bathyarchaeota archaeon]|nr:lamin tail domain-containing protein [Candidatus Bathyarchaeota archaeon]
MVKEGDATRLYLNKSRLALVVLYSALLLAGTLFGVVQTSGADAGSWVGEGNVVDDADVSFGRFPDGEGSWHTLSEVVTPSEPNQLGGITDDLVINEFMANNDAAVPGPDGNYPDWIELYNGGTDSIDLSGMYLSDDLSNPDAWQFQSGTVIEAGGFLVVWADNSPDKGLLHASFALNASGEAVCLFASDAETLIDSIVFTEQPDDVSYGRLPDGGSSWDYLKPTP